MRLPSLTIRLRRGESGLILSLMALAVVVLSGCEAGDTRKLLGLEKTAPVEFKIAPRAPLSLPPDYALRPPAPGAQRPQEQGSTQRALSAITGNAQARAPATSAAGSTGESALLTHAGAARANPDIREVLERENSALASADQTFLDQLMFWRKAEDRSPVVDAPREAQRLRENAAQGLPNSQGDTPSITRRRRAPLEGIF
jgi:hypothetical protein